MPVREDEIMLPDSALGSMKVMFATPCYISAVSMNYVTSIFSLTYECGRLGVECMLHMHSEALITRSRNSIVAKFLEETTYTHLFWIDSDVVFSPGAAFRILLADRDVAAGIYPMKTENWPADGLPAGTTRQDYERHFTDYAFNPVGDRQTPIGPSIDADGFVEVVNAPTGFMAIKRDVFVRMMRHDPTLKYTPDLSPDHPQAQLHWRFFDCLVDPDSGRYLSEDYAFCRRWRDMGGKIYADIHSNLQHAGQRLFSGNLAESLIAQGRI